METLESGIETFLSFAKEQLDLISQGQFGARGATFKKILYCTEIDALAKTVYPADWGPKKRFIFLLRDFSQWDHCEKVSLPHLLRLLRKVSCPEFAKLDNYVSNLISAWEEGTLIMLDRDADCATIQAKVPGREFKVKVEERKFQILDLTHANLFYECRNYLIHEGRKTGYCAESGQDEPPHYQSMIDHDWQLCYPVRFYEIICRNIIRNLRKYYCDCKLDPYDCFRFGSYWIKELN